MLGTSLSGLVSSLGGEEEEEELCRRTDAVGSSTFTAFCLFAEKTASTILHTGKVWLT